MQHLTAFTENEEIYPFLFFMTYKPETAKREEKEAKWVGGRECSVGP